MRPHGTHRLALYLAIAVSSGAILSQLFKSFFDRARPELVPHGQHVYTQSFPSGHSMMAAVTFFTVAALLAAGQPDRRMRAYLLALATVLSISVALSRVYLGVHWPSDVLAGFTAGTAWALLCWSVARVLRRHGSIEGRGNSERRVRRATRARTWHDRF